MRPFARHAAQHRIDQTGKVQAFPVGLNQPDREVDGSMIGNAKKKDLSGPDQQARSRLAAPRRRAAIQEQTEQMPQGAEPAQHGRYQGAGQRAVAFFQQGKVAGRVQHLVERATLAQHPIDDDGGNAPNGKTRHLKTRNLAGATGAGDRRSGV